MGDRESKPGPIQPQPRLRYTGDVWITKEFLRDKSEVAAPPYDIECTKTVEVMIYANLTKPSAYNCSLDNNLRALSTDIVVSTTMGAVRLGDQFHYSIQGDAAVSDDMEYIKNCPKSQLRVYLDKSTKSCVVYPVWENPSVSYHGTRLLSSNFIEPNLGAEEERPPERPGCTRLSYESDMQHIHVDGTVFVDYVLRPRGAPDQHPTKTWHTVKGSNDEWYDPPRDVEVHSYDPLVRTPRHGDFTVSRDGVSVMIEADGGRVACSGPGWVHVGNRAGPDHMGKNGHIVVMD